MASWLILICFWVYCFASSNSRGSGTALILYGIARYLFGVQAGEVIFPGKSGACVPFSDIWILGMKPAGQLPSLLIVWCALGFMILLLLLSELPQTSWQGSPKKFCPVEKGIWVCDNKNDTVKVAGNTCTRAAEFFKNDEYTNIIIHRYIGTHTQQFKSKSYVATLFS